MDVEDGWFGKYSVTFCLCLVVISSLDGIPVLSLLTSSYVRSSSCLQSESSSRLLCASFPSSW
jgi:hypothetical protein